MQRYDRRTFLRSSTALAAGLALPSALLAACQKAVTAAGGATASATATPSTFTRPLSEGNPPIASDLPVEKNATLKIYEYRDYLSRSVLEDFEKKYADSGVRIQTKSYGTVQQAINDLGRPGADFDVFFPTVDTLGPLVNAGILQPLNHDYLPNITNLWPQLQPPNGPRYDVGLRYTTPYTVYTTGIGWRSDLLGDAAAPDERDNPYDVFWDPALKGQIGFYDDYREAIAMTLLRLGIDDVNTASQADLERARESMRRMFLQTDPRASVDGAYEGLPEGEYAVHQAWSGDMIYGAYYARKEGDDLRHLRYWWPEDGRGVIGVDLMAVPTQGKNPVLAHLFLNHLMDYGVAMTNFSWNGYQPPLQGTAPQDFAGSHWASLVPPMLANTIASPQDLDTGSMLMELSPTTRQAWENVWGFQAAVGQSG